MTPWVLLLAPLAGALALLALGRATRDPWRLTACALLVLTLTLGAAVRVGTSGATAGWTLWSSHLAARLAPHGFGRTMIVLVPSVALPVVLFTGSYARAERGLSRLLALLTAFVGFMELLVLAGDFLTLLVAWELVGACSWALIGFDWRTSRAPHAARNAFLTTRVGDLGLYVAAGAAFAGGGTLGFDALAATGGAERQVVAAGVLVAAAAKSAQLPFAPWLFSAMAGPTPASALLHSATMVAAGAYLLVRLGPVLTGVPWFDPAVALLGFTTALAGGIVASVQSDLKRALAASTSAQYGLMLVAVASGFPGAAGVHLVAHAFFKALLFLAAGSVSEAAGTLDLGALGRVAVLRARPWLSRLALIGALALAAVPPLGAAFSKEYIVAAAAQARTAAHWLVTGVVAAALLSAFYSARLWLLAFGPGLGGETPRPASTSATARRGRPGGRLIDRTPAAELGAMALLAVVSVGLGMWYLPGGKRLAGLVAVLRLPDEGSPAAIALSAAVAIMGIGGAWWRSRRGAPALLGPPAAIREWIADWFGLPRVAQGLLVRPTLAIAERLAVLDDRAVDAGVRLAVRTATTLSALLAWWGERGMAGSVALVARAVRNTARASGAADDRFVDGTIERVAARIAALGARSRQLQTGLAHDYYRLVAAGVMVIVIAAAAAVVGAHSR